MESIYKIRLHKGFYDTAEYGFTTILLDDPENPKYDEKEAIKKLHEKTSYKGGYECYSSGTLPKNPGNGKNRVHARFDYSYDDYDIPESIIERIKGKTE